MNKFHVILTVLVNPHNPHQPTEKEHYKPVGTWASRNHVTLFDENAGAFAVAKTA